MKGASELHGVPVWQVKLVDTQTLEVLKVFATDRPANAAALSPIFDQARDAFAAFGV